MTKKQRNNRNKILLASALYLALFFLPVTGILRAVLYLVPYLIVGFRVLQKAGKNILAGRVFDENFLMCVATLGAFACGEYPEAVAVMLFYQVGELFESIAVGKSRASIAELMDIMPEFAVVLRDGEEQTVYPEEVAVDEMIIIRAGERVPLDGVVLEGASSLNTAALTGESVPRDITVGDEVISGCINRSGVLRVRVTKLYENSTVARILDLVENASSKKSKAEHFISKFARYYTPIVVYMALALAIIPPLFVGNWVDWLQRALAFLVVSCPCALVISIPLSFFSGIGCCSRAGILVKGSNYLEALAHADTVVFDKTGTLTKGQFKVSKVVAHKKTADELLELAALVEHQSNHPISKSIVLAYQNALDFSRVTDITEVLGQGMTAKVDGRVIAVGNAKLMEDCGIFVGDGLEATVVHIAVQNQYYGYIAVEDQIKENAEHAIASLKRFGIKNTVMLSGDSHAIAQKVSDAIGLDAVYAPLLPADKVGKTEELLQAQAPNKKLVFVGDGINDAPALSRADIGIAMGAMGSDAAIEAADIVLLEDDLDKIAKAIQIARRTLMIVKQNIVFALGIKSIVLLLTAIGLTGMWAAVFADVGVMVLAIINARRV